MNLVRSVKVILRNALLFRSKLILRLKPLRNEGILMDDFRAESLVSLLLVCFHEGIILSRVEETVLVPVVLIKDVVHLFPILLLSIDIRLDQRSMLFQSLAHLRREL